MNDYEDPPPIHMDTNEVQSLQCDMEHDQNSTLDDSDTLADEEDERFYDGESHEELLAEEDSEDHEIDKDRTTLYEGCHLTREESEILIMSFAARHRLTDVAIDDLVSLIDCHLPRTAYGSKYFLLKEFDSNASNSTIITQFYCPRCHNLLGNGQENRQDKALLCNMCNKSFETALLKREYKYFMRLPLKEQLINIFQSELYSLLRKTCVDETDVISGSVYKKLLEDAFISEHDITIQINLDGVNPTESANVSMWPCQVIINELPYHDRKDNVILCGLWYGKSKPDMPVFLKFFVEELIELHTEGFKVNTPDGEITVKVHAIIASVDSVARPLLQNITQYNGKYGCSYCLHEGETIVVGDGHARVYPPTVGEARTTDQHLQDAENVLNDPDRKPIRGVKGPSIFCKLLPLFNIIFSFVPDYMHSVLLGVVKTIVNALLDSKNHEKPWYIGNFIDEMDEILMKIKPPTEITRTPRSLRDRNVWKASEWKNFLLYYSLLCFQPFLNPLYLQHWFLLVLGMHCLLKDKISQEDFMLGRRALNTYVSLVEGLFCKEFLKFNMHLLCHIPYSVYLYGSLWATSAFPFEHYNGVLGTLFHGTQAIPHQICKSYLRIKIINKASKIIFSARNASVRGKDLFKQLIGFARTKRCVEYGPYLRLFGFSIDVQLDNVQKFIIEELLHESVRQTAQKYERFIFKNVLHHTESYARLHKRNNSAIVTRCGTYLIIREMLSVTCETSDHTTCVIIGNECTVEENAHLARYRSTNLNVTSDFFCHIVTKSDRLVAILPENIATKCVYAPYTSTRSCIMPLVNTVERD